jgi:hypothetical protein
VHTGGVRRADVDPHADHAREIAHGERRLVRIGKPLGEADAYGVLETVGQHPHDEILFRFRRVPRDAKGQCLVHAAIHVGQLDLERVDRGRQCHVDATRSALVIAIRLREPADLSRDQRREADRRAVLEIRAERL